MPFLARLLLVALLCTPQDKPADRIPVPDAAKQKDAEKTVKELFKTEYAKKTPADRQALGRLLLKQAKDSRDDSVAQWVLFREAQDIGAAIPDFDLVFDAVEGVAAIFDVPAAATKLAALAAAGKAAKTPEEFGKLGDQYLKVLDGALAAEDYDGVDKALAGAVQAAKRVNTPAWATKIAARSKEVAEIKSRVEKLKKAIDTLTKDPENAAASFEVGHFKCFAKKNWDEGLPFLAKGSDAGFKAAATKDLAKPAEPERQVEVGDAWWDLAEKERNEGVKRRLHLRAVSWYEQAQAALNGLMKTKADTRIDAQKRRDLMLGVEAFFGDKSANPALLPCDADDGHFEETSVGGKACVRLTKDTIAGSDGTRYLYVNVVPKWQESWKPVEVEMEYFDEGNGNVDIHYDAVSGIYKTGGKSFVLGNSKTWKTFTFTIPDPLFSGRLKGGSDMRVHVFPGSAVSFHRMVVRLAAPK